MLTNILFNYGCGFVSFNEWNPHNGLIIFKLYIGHRLYRPKEKYFGAELTCFWGGDKACNRFCEDQKYQSGQCTQRYGCWFYLPFQNLGPK